MVSPRRDQSREHIKFAPKRGVFARAKSHLSKIRKNALKLIFRVLERESGLGGTGERKRTRTTEDSGSSFGNLSSLKCNGYYE